MNKKAKRFFILSFLLCGVLFALLVYMGDSKSLDKKKIESKDIFLSAVMLPDLAISTESYFVRHRSLANMHDIFLDAPEHIEYFPSTFSISYPNKENLK